MAASPTITSVLGLSAEEVRGCETQVEDLEADLVNRSRARVNTMLHLASVEAMEQISSGSSDAALVTQAGLKTIKEVEVERLAAEAAAAKEPAV